MSLTNAQPVAYFQKRQKFVCFSSLHHLVDSCVIVNTVILPQLPLLCITFFQEAIFQVGCITISKRTISSCAHWFWFSETLHTVVLFFPHPHRMSHMPKATFGLFLFHPTLTNVCQGATIFTSQDVDRSFLRWQNWKKRHTPLTTKHVESDSSSC